MKSFLKVLLLLIFLVAISYGQVYKKGTNNLSIGIGPGLQGIYGSMDIPAISVGYQAGLHKNFSVGGIVGYSSSTYGYSYLNSNYEWKYSYIIIGARGEYHFTEVDLENTDLYGGVTIGYNIVSVSEPSGTIYGYSAEGSYFLYGFHVGGKYYFSPTVGGFLELGYGVGYIIAGVTFKL